MAGILPGRPRAGGPARAPGSMGDDGRVPTLTDLVRDHTDLTETDLEWLHALVSDWQLLADLSFADLLLWVPLRSADALPAEAASAADAASGAARHRRRRPRLGGDRADAPHDRPDRLPRRPRRQGRPDGAPQADRHRVAGAPDRPGGRPRVGQRHPRPGGVHPGAARREGPRGDPAQHEPQLGAHPVPAGADLPAERQRPRHDDLRGTVPGAGRGAEHGPLATRRRRPDAARPRKQGHLREPERAVGVPAARLPDGPRRRGARPGHRGPVRHRRADGGGAERRAVRPGAARGGGRVTRVDHAAADDPARRRRDADRRHRPVPGRHRAALAGPGAADQGRHHPGDPPPGEEQPADGRGAAALQARRLRIPEGRAALDGRSGASAP